MARKLRVEYAGACYHVINRGNYRRDLFAGKGATESFQQCLLEAARRLHAFVMMQDHFHLAVEIPDTPAGWRRYVAYLGVVAEEEAELRAKKFGRFSRGWVIGSAEFKAEMKNELLEQGAARARFELLGADAEAHRAMRAEVWEGKLTEAKAVLGLAGVELPARKSAAEKVRLAALMKLTSSVSNGWLAERLEMGRPASVSQYVRRFRISGGLETAKFKRALSRVNP